VRGVGKGIHQMRNDRRPPADLAEFFRWIVGDDPPMDDRLFRQVRSNERVMECVTSLEIVHRIRFGFPKNARFDKIENHIAEIFAPAHSPVLEDRRHHGTILLQRILPDTLQKLLPGNVRIQFAGFLPRLDCEIERIAKEVISFAIEPGVLLDDVLEFFTKIKFLHILGAISRRSFKTPLAQRLPADNLGSKQQR